MIEQGLYHNDIRSTILMHHSLTQMLPCYVNINWSKSYFAYCCTLLILIGLLLIKEMMHGDKTTIVCFSSLVAYVLKNAR